MLIIILRTIIVFAVLLFSMRLMGKRQLGELELSELVVAVLISDIAAHPLQDIGIPIMNGLIPAIVLLCCELIISGLAMKNPKIRLLLYGKPSILISEGCIDQQEMRRNRFTIDELYEELRKHAVMDISKVKYAILETAGTLSVIQFPAECPVTPSQLGIQVEDSQTPVIIINDGRIMTENLQSSGKSEKWLKSELRNRGARDPRDVYLMSLDASGKIYYAPLTGKGK